MAKVFGFSYDKTIWTWFDIAWPWIGLLAAMILLILLFASNLLRQNSQIKRWRDPIWLSWLAIPIYMLHEFEEYGIDFLGNRHAFPDGLCNNLGLGDYPQCPVPHEFYLYVNIPLVWVIALIAAMLSWRNSYLGLGLYSVIVSNGFVHIMTFLLMRKYNPGVFTSFVIFLPSFFWIFKCCFSKTGFPRRGITVLVITGILLHVILISSLLLFVNLQIGEKVLNFIQVFNASVIIVVPWIGDRLFRITNKRLSA
jgi:hypothetical protein